MELLNQKLKFDEPVMSFGKTGEINPQSKIDSIYVTPKRVTIKGHAKFLFAETSCTFEYSAEIKDNKLSNEETAVNAYNDFVKMFNNADVEHSWANRDKLPVANEFTHGMKSVTTFDY